MRRDHHALFGMYVPGRSWLHRLGAGGTYALVLLGSLPALVVQQLWLSLSTAAFFALLLLSTRLPARTTLRVTRLLVLVVACLVGYHWLSGQPATGIMLGATMVACVWGARVLTLTTPGPALVDALVTAASPLRLVGLSPERLGLAIGVMLRSIPHLMGAFDDVRDACRARGVENRLSAQVAPVVVHAVAYAHATGEALAARGLGDDD